METLGLYQGVGSIVFSLQTLYLGLWIRDSMLGRLAYTKVVPILISHSPSKLNLCR